MRLPRVESEPRTIFNVALSLIIISAAVFPTGFTTTPKPPMRFRPPGGDVQRRDSRLNNSLKFFTLWIKRAGNPKRRRYLIGLLVEITANHWNSLGINKPWHDDAVARVDNGGALGNCYP